MHNLINLLLHNQNAFASGGLLLMAVGGVLATLRKVPERMWDWLVHQTTMHMTITDECQAFLWFKEWYQEQKHAKKSRRVDVFVPDNSKQALFTPAPGRHWFFYKRRPIWVSLSRSEEKKQSNYTAKRAESFNISTVGRNQEFLRQMIAEISEIHQSRIKEKPQLFVWVNDWWNPIAGYQPRQLNSVILPAGQTDRIVADIQRFIASRSWYESLGIPYHRGYLFYGPPGTGKTSLVTALSSYFNNRVYLLKLNQHNDNSLIEAVKQCQANSFIVLEDIDCVQAAPKSREAESATNPAEEKVANMFGVTLSGLLNVLDGIESPAGVMFFMTTNKMDQLDPALLRPGRVDVKELIGEATPQQKQQLLVRFFPDEESTALLEKSQAKTMAEFQGELLVERNHRLAEEAA